MYKISVIVPIYNTEKYLKRCVDSILSQEEVKLEIILVNDGSNDGSGQIAKEYAEKYPNQIIYLEKENGGLSDSRNYGVERAKGDYLAFVDSDDYLQKGVFSQLVPYMEKEIDLIKYKTIKVEEDGREIERIAGPVFEEKTGEEAFSILFPNDVMLDAAWLYLYKTKFYRESEFSFAKGAYHEDFGMLPLVVSVASKVASVDVYGYCYVQTAGSITRNPDYEKTVKRAWDMLKHYDNRLQKMEGYGLSKKAKENLKIYDTNALILKTEELQAKEQKEYIRELRKRKVARNIKARNGKQLIKKIILFFSIKLYLKMR